MNRGERVEAVLAELPHLKARAGQKVLSKGGAAAVLEEARPFGLGALLSHLLPALFPSTRADELSAAFRHRRAERCTAEVLQLLQRRGVEAILLKGLAVARLYPRPELRPTSDVDLLIRPAQLRQAIDALVGAGYRVDEGLPTSPHIRSHHVTLGAPGKLPVELHFTPSVSFFARFDVEGLFARSVEVTLGAVTARILGPEDELLHLCVHAACNGLVGVKWLFDLKLLLDPARDAAIDWDALAALAGEAHASSATAMCLAEARRRLNVELPPDLERRLGLSPARAAAARLAFTLEDPKLVEYGGDLLLADALSADWAVRLVSSPVALLSRGLGLRSALMRLWARPQPVEGGGDLPRRTGS